MKVLLLTPNFWTSGTVTFIRELQRGWPAEWPKPVIATVTKSGKRSSKWGRTVQQMTRADSTPWQPDVCDTRERLVEYSREFDLVHVNEVETRASGQEYWYELLERLPVPFTVQLHGNRYERVDWSRVRSARSFTGVVWQTPGNVPEGLRRPGLHLVPIPRPWNLRPFVAPATSNTAPLVGFHGRLTPDKGAQYLAALARHACVDVCVHGASIGGGYPFAYGLQQTLFGEIRTRSADAPWVWSACDGASLRYEGPYADGVEVSRHHTVHVSATREGFSGGTEYTLLEAIDAGCTIVQPKHMLEPTSPLRGFTYEWEHRGLRGALKNPLESLTRAVQTALLSSSYDAGYNRSVVAVRHDPANLARAFFGVAASRA